MEDPREEDDPKGRSMTSIRGIVGIALALGMLAGMLRFYRLGDWPFSGDELATITETDRFFDDGGGGASDQFCRLPKLIPLSYIVHHLGYQWFGRDEFGSRVSQALLGMVHVVLAFVLLHGPLGRPTAVATALLIALWPEHIHRSQENRFYMTACVFASLCMLAGGQAVYRRSPAWAVFAGLVAGAAVFTHSLLGVLWGGLFLGFFAVAYVASDRRLRRWAWFTVAGASLIVGATALYIVPLTAHWNAGETWSYGQVHALQAAVSQFGWPATILASIGVVAALQSRNEQDWYWLAWASAWLVSSVILPCIVIYHPGYSFPLSLGILVMAGRGIARIYEGLRAQGSWTATAWVGLACLVNFPSLVSHYADGDCYDYRAAARYISLEWQEGDRVLTFSPTLLKHYSSPEIQPIGVSASNIVDAVVHEAAGAERVWIVVPSSRTGQPEPVRAWLGAHCSRRFHLQKRRFDYYENIVEVYLYCHTQDASFGFSTPTGLSNK